MRLAWYVFFTAIVAVAFPREVFAQNSTLADMMTTASTQVYGGFPVVLSVLSYVAGAALAFWSVLKFRDYTDGKASLSDPVWRLVGGTLLIALPYVINTVMNSLYTSGYADGNEDDYTSGLNTALSNAGGGNCSAGLDQCMIVLVSNIYGPAEVLISVVTWIMGGMCVAIGLFRLAQSGQSAQGNAPKARGTIGYIAGGGLLISLGEFMDVIRDSIFGGGQTPMFNALAFNNNVLPGNLNTMSNGVFMALFAWMQLIGWLAFARGVYLLVKLSQGEGQRTHAHAFTHIIGGALAVNLYGLVDAIQSTLGISLATGS
jgi:hypothetical protein